MSLMLIRKGANLGPTFLPEHRQRRYAAHLIAIGDAAVIFPP